MAKPQKTKRVKNHSTKNRPSSNKLPLKRNSQATPKSKSLSTTGCTCCDCSTLSSGGVFTCEDGISVYIPKPNYYAVLVSDPNFALPYFARPSDLGLNCPAAPIPPTPPMQLGKKLLRKKKAARK